MSTEANTELRSKYPLRKMEDAPRERPTDILVGCDTIWPSVASWVDGMFVDMHDSPLPDFQLSGWLPIPSHDWERHIADLEREIVALKAASTEDTAREERWIQRYGETLVEVESALKENAALRLRIEELERRQHANDILKPIFRATPDPAPEEADDGK